MRAAVLNESHRLEVAEVADPSPGPGELVLQVTACGICGSDLKLRPSMPAGLVMGHEFCGEIVATGADTDPGWQVGRHVTALSLIGCGQCLACLAGEPAHCVQADMVGVGGSLGALAEYVRVDQRETIGLPDDLDPRSARWSNRWRWDCTRSSEPTSDRATTSWSSGRGPSDCR